MASYGALPSGALVAGKYEIVGRAGSGGMGIVYKARDIKLDRLVALKFLPEELSSSPQRKAQFLREAKIASQLDHPNIGTIYGVEEADGGRTFIVMAFYEGVSFAMQIAHHALPAAQVVKVAMQVAHRSRRSTLEEHRSSRYKAFEHHDHEERCGEDCGFWHRPRHTTECNMDAGDFGNGRLHVSRADAGKASRPTH